LGGRVVKVNVFIKTYEQVFIACIVKL
jgi:hypothetical protein